jgi:hypothetical protein
VFERGVGRACIVQSLQQPQVVLARQRLAMVRVLQDETQRHRPAGRFDWLVSVQALAARF